MINDDEIKEENIIRVLKHLIRQFSCNDKPIVDYIHENASRHAHIAVAGLVKEALKETNTKFHQVTSLGFYEEMAKDSLQTALDFMTSRHKKNQDEN